MTKAEPKIAPAYALGATVASALVSPEPFVPPVPRSATQQVAEEAAAQQVAAAHAPPHALHRNEESARDRATSDTLPDIEGIIKRWPDVIEAVRRNRPALAQAVQRLTPQQIGAHGALLASYLRTEDTWAGAIESSRPDVLAALQSVFPGITTFTLRAVGQGSGDARSNKRLTAQDVQQQRTDQLTSRSALLDAAVRTLDLELLD